MITAFSRRLHSMGRGARPRCAGAVPSMPVACLTKQQWRDLPEDISSGWWLLIAEVLAVLILIILAYKTGPKAQSMQSSIDAMALATLARNNPRALCINASLEPVIGTTYPDTTLAFELVWIGKDNKTWHAGTEPGVPDLVTAGARPMWPWAFPHVSREGNLIHVPEDPTYTARANYSRNLGTGYAYEFALAREALLAMRKCKIISGAYNSYDLPSFIMRGAVAEAKAWAQVLNISIWSGNDSLTVARLNDGTWKKVEVHSAYDMDFAWASHGGYMWGELGPGSELLPEACEVSGGPGPIAGGQTVWSIDCQGGRLGWMTSYFATLKDSQLPIPMTNMAPGMLRMDAIIGDRSYKGSVWLQFASQTDATAMCLAQKAPQLLRYLTMSTRTLEPFEKLGDLPNASVPRLKYIDGEDRAMWPHSRGLTAYVWVVLAEASPFSEWLLGNGIPYACARGVDVSSPDANTMLSTLAALNDAAKSKLKVTMFLSMKDSSQDDVNAVYTGILGALFGSVALLVATLFMFVLAILKRARKTRRDLSRHVNPDGDG